jgi:2-oxoglutarate dehydrogenase E2 component (dihydrolipoamide succinyltransferase)
MATTSVVEVVMPQMGVSVSEGTITKWLKQVGDTVEADESLLEISTDKVDTEVPSPGTGVLQEILVHEGATVDVGTKLATIAPRARRRHRRSRAARAGDAAGRARGEAPVTPRRRSRRRPRRRAAAAATDAERQDVRLARRREDRVRARRRPGQVPGTGRGGRVTKKDILGFIESGAQARAAGAEPARRRRSPRRAAPPRPRRSRSRDRAGAGRTGSRSRGRDLEPMTAMRRGIAEHMRRSLDTAAHVTSAIEVDMSKVVAIRAKLKKQFQEDYGVNPTYLAFVSRAVVETLREYPWINGEIRGDQIVTRKYVNLGYAVELADGKGLIVPVVKNAEGSEPARASRAA